MTKVDNPRAPAAPPVLARLFPDLPVDDGQPLQFDFEGPARTLAELALNPDNRTPFTVVVKGGWGRGKTTLLRRAKWLLEHPDEVAPAGGRRRVETLWFNAWKYPCEDTVLAGLLGALLDKLHKGNLGEQLRVLIDSYKGSLVGKVLYLAAPAPVKDLFGGAGLRSRFSPVAEKRAFHDTFRDLFSQVSRLLFDPVAAVRDTAGVAEEAHWTPERARRETLAVFLDDLDRCRTERVAEVLEAINLFLDLPGVCFYLGIDWGRLVAALPEPVRAQGDQYLEKIVQVALDLPAVSAGGAEGYIRSLVGGGHLGEVLGGGEDGAIGAVAAALASRHPRHVKRFLNDLALTLAVLRNAGKLGPGAEQVPAEAVLAWHLLSELLPAEEWREVRALTVNARSFLRKEKELATSEAGDGPATRSRLGALQLETLTRLTERQLHLLVHLASPATQAEHAGHAGRLPLLDLDGEGWVYLRGGTFSMGSEAGQQHERPVHRVSLRPFGISRFPVTNAEYAAYLQETGKLPPEHWEGKDFPTGLADHPVVNILWSDAEAFCTWLSRRFQSAGRHGRAQLPSEAQWEFAARGVDAREYPWGDAQPDGTRANFGRMVGGTTPVGAYPDGATQEGVHDLAGNVWEWCQDWFGPYSDDEQHDPSGPEHGSVRVMRGGSFNLAPRFIRGACRSYPHSQVRYDDVGLRVVWMPGLERT